MGCDEWQRDLVRNKNDFLGFLWNPNTKEVCGRTAASWCEIMVFYVFFYGLLAAWWASLLYARVSFLPEIADGPYHMEYIPHRGPGMSMVPVDEDGDKQLTFDIDSTKAYKDKIEQFFKAYTSINGHDFSTEFEMCGEDFEGECVDNGGESYLGAMTIEVPEKEETEEIEKEELEQKENEAAAKEAEAAPSKDEVVENESEAAASEEAGQNQTEAAADEPIVVRRARRSSDETEEDPKKVKLFNLFNLGECFSDPDYGYAEGEPCVYFTINKAFGWKPEPLSGDRKTEVEEATGQTTSPDFIPFICQGIKSHDRELIESIEVFPKQGISSAYFPWDGQETYVKPLVAAKIRLVPEGFGQRIRIECKAKADNFHPNMAKPNSGRAEIVVIISKDTAEEQVVEEEIIPEENANTQNNFHPNMAKPNCGRTEILVTISKDTAEEHEVVEEEIIPEENANTQK